MELFTPIIAQEKLHPNFLAIIAPTAAGVRKVLSNWAEGFIDRDGKFVLEFQTTFNSSFRELYLFAVLKYLKISVDFSQTAPDFISRNKPIAIEAAIASHAQDDVPEWKKTIEGIVGLEIGAAYTQAIIRLSNAILGKVKAYRTKYANLSHMHGRSYIIAVSNFGTQDFNLLGDVPMQRLIYDVWEEQSVVKPNGARVPVGLFRTPALADVGGILFSSVATFGKVRALGDDDGKFIFNAIRIRNNVEPINVVESKENYRESLADGLRLFLNPFATSPVDPSLFDDDGIRRFMIDQDGSLVATCHPEGDLCMRQIIRVNEP